MKSNKVLTNKYYATLLRFLKEQGDYGIDKQHLLMRLTRDFERLGCPIPIHLVSMAYAKYEGDYKLIRHKENMYLQITMDMFINDVKIVVAKCLGRELHIVEEQRLQEAVMNRDVLHNLCTILNNPSRTMLKYLKEVMYKDIIDCQN